MTYQNYEFTAFQIGDLRPAGESQIDCGETFTMPSQASVCFNVSDNDSKLSGDNTWLDDHATDTWGQTATIEGPGGAHLGNGGQIYAESYFWVYDQHGNWYALIEIEQEGSHQKFYTFHEGYGVPADGAHLTVHSQCDVTTNWIDFNCLDAGEKEPALGSIKGTLFDDENHDNTQWNAHENRWEDGIEGAKVELIDENGNVVATATTDAHGNYEFTDVAGGNYKVKFYNPDGTAFVHKDVGHDSNDSDANSNGVTDFFHLANGQDLCNIDAGVKEIPTGKISGTAWHDEDCDGEQDGTAVIGKGDNIFHGSVTFEGVNCSTYNVSSYGDWYSVGHQVIDLIQGSDEGHQGNPHDNILVELDPGGIWCRTFEAPEAGTYCLVLDVYENNLISQADNKFSIFINGQEVEVINVLEDGKVEVEVELNAGHNQIDFKSLSHAHGKGPGIDNIEMLPLVEVSRTLDEAPKEGVVVQLIDAHTHEVVMETTTDANGYYEFDGVPVGNYKIIGLAPDGTKFTIQDVDGNSKDNFDSDVNANGTSGVVCVTKDSHTDIDLGLCLETGTITGTVWCDLDCDGEQDSVTTVEKGDNIFVGSVTFEGVNCSTYNVSSYGDWYSVGYQVIDLVQGSDEGHQGNPHDNILVELDPGGIWCRTFEAPEAGTYCLVLDVYENNLISQADNKFSIFINGQEVEVINVLEDGKVEVEVELNAGHNQIDFKSLSHAHGKGPGIDNIEMLPLIEVTTATEPVKEGVLIKLLNVDGSPVLDADGVEITTLTLEDGSYTFNDVPVGDYTIMGVAPDGTEFTIQDVDNNSKDDIDSDVDENGMSGVITVTDGSVSDIDLGVCEKPATIVGTYFNDNNRDNLQDAGDTPVVAATVILLLNGVEIDRVDTDSDGNYIFEDVEPGAGYSLQFVNPGTGEVFVEGNSGADDTIDSDVDANGITETFSLVAGETKDYDAGIADPSDATISGTYFCDENDNSVQDAGEPGVGGILVTLLDINGNPVIGADGLAITDTTDTDGTYTLTGVPAGTYKVAFGADPTGKVFVEQDVNGNTQDDIDSDVNGAGETQPITVGISDTLENVDAGVEDPRTAAVGDTVFSDDNGNGVRDAGEAGVAGVDVTVISAGDDGLFGTADDVIEGTDTTDADGDYLVENLAAGDYQVRFDAAATGLDFTAPSADAADAENDDSDADANGATGTFTLDIGETERNIDAGLVDPEDASISGRLFEDTDGDNLDNNNGDEPGVPNVEVRLLDGNGNPVIGADGLPVTEITDADGNYTFGDLPKGEYIVEFPLVVDGKTLVNQGVGVDTSDPATDTGRTPVIDLGLSETVTDVDAGIADPSDATISGTYFCDENDNSVQDAGEPGVGGILVTLLDINGNPVIGADGLAITDTTDTDGTYTLTGVPAGTYKVAFGADPTGKVFVEQDVNGNTQDDIDSDVNGAGETQPITVGISDTLENVDAGVEDPRTAAVGDTVFSDDNGNGVRDAGEAGVAGVDVTVISAGDDGLFGTADDVIEGTDTTDADGDYLVENLAAGDYQVRFDAAATGLDFTAPSADAADAENDDSDADANGATGTFTLDIGETERNIDAGLVDPEDASISGRLFEDTDGDNLDNNNGDEPGVPNVEVRLLDGNGNPVIGADGLPVTEITDADGNYTFGDLPKGEYIVEFPLVVDGKTLVNQGVGVDTSDPATDTGRTPVIDLGLSETVTDVDAGIADPSDATISGTYFCDENDNSVQDAGEPGVGGILVTLLDINGNPVIGADGLAITDTTDTDGTYTLTGVPAGTYKVAFGADPTGKVFVEQDVNGNTQDDIDSDVNGAGETQPITVGISDTLENVDAGVEDPRTAAVGDTVFSDDNGNGVRDAGEAGVAGVDVTVISAGDDGLFGTADDVIEGTDTTDADGDYLVENLAAGDYQVRFDAAATGLDFTAPSADAADAENDDSDADANGATGTFTLDIGETERNIDAGLVDPEDASISGRLFEDTDGDNLDNNNGDEPGVPNVEVRLLDGNGNPVIGADGLPVTEITDADGNYTFGDLPKGEYIVEFPLVVDGKTLVNQGVGVDTSDPATDTGRTPVIDLGLSETVTDVDAGIADPSDATISGTYFCDENDNSVQDAGEPGVGGILVTLLDINGNPVIGADGLAITDTTDTDGTYTLTGVPAGTYKVAFGADPTGKVFVEQDVNGNTQDDIDSDVNGAGETQPITVGISDTLENVDAGVEDPRTAAVGDTVFSDDNGNGVRDAGEAGVAGVDVTVISAGDDGLFGTADDVIEGTDTTDADGDYLVENLAAGDYQVRFDAAATGLDFTAPSADAADAENDDSDADANGATGTFTLDIGETERNIDAGLVDPEDASISGRLFEDTDGDNLDNNNGDEPGVPNVEVRLLDGNGNPVIGADGLPVTEITDADGNYTFGDLPKGEYIVEFPLVVDGKTLVNQGVGVDTSDPATDTGRTPVIDLGLSETVTDVDAGIADPSDATISGTYFCDENDNSVQDAGEPGVGGILVTLLDINGNPVIGADGLAITDTTDTDGTYTLTGVPAGTYKVAFGADPTGKVFVEQDVNGNTQDDIDSDVNGAGETQPITVGISDTLENVDAGVEDPRTAAVGDTVFSDDNGNGVRDAGEAGVAGVDVTVISAGDDGLFGTADDVIEGTDTTDADGDYLVENLAAGDYQVRFDAAATGLDFTAPSADAADAENDDSDADANGATGTFTLDIGETERNIDAGLVDPEDASISGRLFEDTDGDNLDNNNGDEPGVPNVEVRLLDGNGNPVIGADGLPVTEITDADGNYTFGDLPKGEYIVEFPLVVDGKTLVNQGVGVDTSDPATDTGRTPVIDLGLSETVTDVDAGIAEVDTLDASVGNLVFFDTNDNGVFDGADFGVADIDVYLIGAGADGMFNSADDTMEFTFTDENGFYLFDNLAAGDYRVEFDASFTDFEFTAQSAALPGAADNDSDADAAGVTGSFTLGIGEVQNNIDAGLVDPATGKIGDYVFCDLNENGIQDADDIGLDGVTVTLTGAGVDGVFDTADDFTFVDVTENGGEYLFENLKAGFYKVNFDSTTTGGKVFISQGDLNPLASGIDSDADANGDTAVFRLDIGEELFTIDAGVVDGNTPPAPQDDAAMTCADELKTVDVLANDGTLVGGDIVDADGDILTIVEVDGQAIAEGDTIETSQGTFVTLTNGQLVIDGEAAYAYLDINANEVENISYTVSDGTALATANLEMMFCGDANSVESLIASLPESVKFKVADGFLNNPFGDFGYDLLITEANGDTRLEGVTFQAAYCLDVIRDIQTGSTFNNAVEVMGDVSLFNDVNAAATFTADQIGVNGLATDNVNEINWLLNQDFENDGTGSVDGNFTGWEVQFALWELTNAFDSDATLDFVPSIGQVEDVDYIVERAIAEGFDFEAGVGDVIGVIINPNPATPQNEQPFLVAINFEDYDCIC